ncbi:NLI interacting factor-like phosphatase [Coprinopsis marcescibilis]|uniref:NLI interacting factor-like phosphatase n=1 Tax=Coprinopsis marcescibilis TaxID=230819 RepID=A0A5C3L9V3_COPMA|nr:NLI interacting factor-like phosphatase [Coprinopsis marcescibilis]
MNTLGYVARQLDVLAAPRAPPSTPTTESFSQDLNGLHRVNTWSTKSFLFAPSSNTLLARRSHSSPSFDSTSSSALSPPPSTPSPDHVLVDPTLPPSRSKHHLESVINQIFFMRVFLVVWRNLKAMWSSVIDHLDAFNAFNWRRALITVQTSEPNEKGKAKALSIPIPPPATLSAPHTPSQLSIDSTVSSPGAAAYSRSATPVLSTKKAPLSFHLPKTLVLDLDETLIHSTSRPMQWQGGSGLWALGSFGRRNKGAGRMIEVVLNGKSTLYHVYKRPFVDYFLRKVSGWYTLVIFTASMQEYADPVIDWLDAGTGVLAHRFFRDSCTQLPNGSYTKDLSVIDSDLSRICLIDNSPTSYTVNEANGIPIEGWTNDPSDEALLDLLPVLDSLRFTSDVRRVLGLRCVSHHPKS